MNQASLSVACRRCRKQKLRCTREQPECHRCMRKNYPCSYPPPPNRKKLAAQRAQGGVNPTGSNQAASLELPSSIHGTSNIDCSPSRHAQNLVSCSRHNVVPGSSQHSSQGVTAALSSVTQSTNERSSIPDSIDDMHLAEEVALFLIEIYFERHYQADLLFQKQTFIEDYLRQRLPSFVSLAAFAFASLFLTHVPGGVIHGNLDVTGISTADWREIGERWAEQASKAVLMNADKPCLEHVQACQILAMFWLAKSETRRTNMHSAIAYRSCRILQFHRLDPEWADQYPMESNVRTRCFWACWLTKCASQLNSGFPLDCWAEAVDCPLPEDSASGSMPNVKLFVDEAGSIHQQGVISSVPRLGFNSSLVIIHGLWWEVQHFVYSLQQKRHTVYDPALRIYALDERLEGLHDRMNDSIRYLSSSVITLPNSTILSRIFSLNYTYHLCLCYLYSALVPILSCGTQIPSLPKRILRLAAEQAWKHSSIMLEMAENFLARKGVISKLWPMVGYGAYVCAAIQLRCLLALESLSVERLERYKILLRLTSELRSYWTNLKPLHVRVEQLFVQAQKFLSTHNNHWEKAKQSPEELVDAIIDPEASSTVHWRTSISTYVADEDRKQLPAPDPSQYSDPASSTEVRESPEPYNNSDDTLLRPQYEDSTDTPDVAESWTGEQSTTTSEFVYEVETFDALTTMQNNGTWWNQAPDAFADVFGQDFLVPEHGFLMDMY